MRRICIKAKFWKDSRVPSIEYAQLKKNSLKRLNNKTVVAWIEAAQTMM